MITRFFRTAILSTTSLTGVVYAAERVGDFSLLDHIGNHHQMSWDEMFFGEIVFKTRNDQAPH